MTHIITEKLHWVFKIDDGRIMYYLGDQNNKRIRCPELQNLTEKEKRELRLNFIFLDEYKGGRTVLHSGNETDCKIKITAPLFIKEGKSFYKCGMYTDDASPLEIARICKLVDELIPRDKIKKDGNYVEDIL